MAAHESEQLARTLSAHGLRLTRQRRAVLDVVLAAPATMSPIQVFDAARELCPELGLTTVYRTLDVLSDVGALRRVHGLDHCEGFVAASAAHGHTIVCETCGRTTEFTECDMKGMVAAAGQQTGYVITDHFLQLTGLCPRCARQDHTLALSSGREPAED